MRWITRFILFCVFGLVGCAPIANKSTPTVSIEPLPTSSMTATLSPSLAPTHAPTSTATATVTQTLEPTWTPLPTLAPVQARQYVEDLLTHNAGCKLPCWWGIVPGETTWAQALHTMESFITRFSVGEIQEATIKGNKINARSTSVHYDVPGGDRPGVIQFLLSDDIVIFVDVSPTGTDRSYKLYQIFNEYGKPADIFTEIFPNSGWNQGFLILHYPEQGIIVEYEVDAMELDTHYQTCFHATSPTLRLWYPELNLTITDIYPYGNIPISRNISPLEDTTGISIDDFFESYQSAADTECLEL